MTKNYQVVFRADANEKIGLGHITRVSDIADVLEKEKIKTCILTYSPPHVVNFIKNRHSIDVFQMRNELESEFGNLSTTIRHLNPRVIFIDLLDLDTNSLYMKKMSVTNAKIISITDDSREREVMANVQIHCNPIHHTATNYLSNNSQKKYFGEKYAVLNPAFTMIRNSNRDYVTKMSKLLVIFGGFDTHYANEYAIAALKRTTFNGEIRFIISPLLKNVDKLKTLSNNFKNIDFFKGTSPQKLAELMKQSDAIIGSSGNAAYEAAILGTPFIALNLVPRQNENAAALEALGAIINLGMIRATAEAALSLTIDSLLLDKERRQNIGRRAMELFDGKGINRVVDIIKHYCL